MIHLRVDNFLLLTDAVVGYRYVWRANDIGLVIYFFFFIYATVCIVPG